jgi:hypothetical protein
VVPLTLAHRPPVVAHMAVELVLIACPCLDSKWHIPMVLVDGRALAAA